MKQHPELQKGEMFLTNVDLNVRYVLTDAGFYLVEEIPDCRECYNCIDYESKRLGDIAYDIHDKKVKSLRPVFVSKKEYEANIKKAKKG